MVNIYGSGGGGITSSDVTASKADVLNTVATITNDSADEMATGTLANIGASEKYKKSSIANNNLYLGITSGAHVTNAASGYPEVTVPLSELRTIIGYTSSDNVLSDTTIAGLKGTMQDNGAINKTLAINDTYTVPKGYHNGQGTVRIDKSYSSKAGFNFSPNKPSSIQLIQSKNVFMSGDIILKGDTNLKAENIKQGITIYGVKGTAVDYEAGMVTY